MNLAGYQIPFRETHHIVGRAVALAESQHCPLSKLTLQDLKGLNDKFDDDVVEVFDFETSVQCRKSIGGTHTTMIRRQIGVLKAALGD